MDDSGFVSLHKKGVMEREQAKTIDTLIHIHLGDAREGGEGRRGDSRREKT